MSDSSAVDSNCGRCGQVVYNQRYFIDKIQHCLKCYLEVTKTKNSTIFDKMQVMDEIEKQFEESTDYEVSCKIINFNILKYLHNIKEAAESACEVAYINRNELCGAINFSDLHCTEAIYYLTETGLEGYYVTIEEANPTAQELKDFITCRLYDAGFKNVEIRLEW